MISWADDYPIHQTPTFVRVPATTDRNFYDRYWFVGYETDGSAMFGFAFGRYANRFVADAHATIVVDGVQHSLHASGPAPLDPTDTSVGPIRLEIAEPMRELVLHIGGVQEGITGELRFEATTGTIDEGRTRAGRHGQLNVDQTRFMQHGTWHGWFEIDGRRVELDRTTCHGVRDKSWGIRPMAEQSASVGGGGQLFWMNVVREWDGAVTIARTTNGPAGTAWDRAGYRAPMYDSPDLVPFGERALTKLATWDFDLELVPGTRRIAGASYRFAWRDGSTTELVARPVTTLWYSGMGYEHRRWQHGLDHGGLAVERESRRVDAVDLDEPEGRFMCHLLEFSEDGRPAGHGHTEQLFLGRYEPYGWGDQS